MCAMPDGDRSLFAGFMPGESKLAWLCSLSLHVEGWMDQSPKRQRWHGCGLESGFSHMSVKRSHPGGTVPSWKSVVS